MRRTVWELAYVHVLYKYTVHGVCLWVGNIEKDLGRKERTELGGLWSTSPAAVPSAQGGWIKIQR